jgi:hypothetical protein
MSDAEDDKRGIRLFRTPVGWTVRLYDPETGAVLESKSFTRFAAARAYRARALYAASDVKHMDKREKIHNRRRKP